MKKLIMLIAVVCLAQAALGQQPAQTPKPGPEHQKLAILLGDWTYEGQAKDSPLGPAGKFSGKMTARPILGGFFVESRGHETAPGWDIDWVETDGYDPVGKKYTWAGYDSGGGSAAATYTLDGATMSYAGTMTVDGKQYYVRGTSVYAPDLMSCADKREISTDGKTWAPFAESKATKVKEAATAGANTPAEQELINLENRWEDASLKGDTAFLERIMAEDFTDTDPEGTVSTKAQDIANIKSGELKFTSATIDDMKARVYGDAAVVTGRNTMKGQFKGKDISGQYRWTDTWVKRDGRWQCVAGHASTIAAGVDKPMQTNKGPSQ
jgi:ketosteroid isomerase-like protein